MEDPKTRFSGCAEAYAAHRPAYPATAIDRVLEGLGPRPTIADLGAGTGISSRLMAERGAQVLGVEPNRAMRERAGEGAGVTFVDGSAEGTTLREASVDGATAFQAFHWFANERAIAEIRRIVRPGGIAALVLNERDERDSFTAAYGALVRRYAADDTEQRRVESMTFFERLPGVKERSEHGNEQWVDKGGLIGRTRSASYLPHEGPTAEALEREVGAVFDRFAADGRARLALSTWVVRVRLP